MISKTIRPALSLATFVFLSSAMITLANAQTNATKLSALIIDGQNNHAVWPKSTVMMKQYLEDTGLFDVAVARTKFTWRGEREKKFLALAGGASENLRKPKMDPDFAPSFKDFDVVISNFGFNAAPWPEATKEAFVKYVADGGGFVTIHAADNCFGDWPEYNQIIGIGGWGGRKANSGVYIYYNNDGELIRDEGKGKKVGAHGPRHPFPITVRAEHPITAGLPQQWLTAEDECYSLLRGPAENMTVLATGKDMSGKAPTNRHEPVLMVLQYKEGRIFHSTLGHDTPAFEGVGFITTFTRGCQWAATGKVTLSVPDDFPTLDQSSGRKFKLAAAPPHTLSPVPASQSTNAK